MVPAAKRCRYSLEPDVTITVEGEVFHLNSFPLMASSQVFHRLLTSPMSEALSGNIDLPGKLKEEFRLVLPWLTKVEDKTKLTKNDNVEILLRWAREYEIKALKDECEHHLMLWHSADNVPALELATEFGLHQRVKQCVDAISCDLSKHINDVPEEVVGNEATMKLLWPKMFENLQLDVPDFPSMPFLQKLWPVFVMAIESECLPKGYIYINVRKDYHFRWRIRVKPSSTTVHDLKVLICAKSGIPVMSQDLRLKRRSLKDMDTKTLSASRIKGNDSINLFDIEDASEID